MNECLDSVLKPLVVMEIWDFYSKGTLLPSNYARHLQHVPLHNKSIWHVRLGVKIMGLSHYSPLPHEIITPLWYVYHDGAVGYVTTKLVEEGWGGGL